MNVKSITIKDIAKALNISISTVSKAMRNSHEISDETRRMVENYAILHQYRPNPLAQGLRKGRSNTLGVVVAVFDNNFYSQVIDGIESYSNEHHYSVVFTQSRESYEKEKRIVQNLVDRSLDGLLISLSSGTRDLEYLKELYGMGVPIILFDRISDEIDTHKVICNNYRGGYDATIHLIENGYRNIAHITSNLTLSFVKERLNGYKDALLSKGFKYKDSNVFFCDQGEDIYQQAYNVVHKIINQSEKPDAILCGSDYLSTTTFKILKKLRIKIPEEMAVVGFSNSATAEIFNPSFTTVDQPAFEMGRKATELLIKLIDSKRKPIKYETIVLNPILQIRESSQKRV